MTSAREIMTAAPVHLSGETTLDKVAQQLASDDIGMVPICNSEGRLEGVVTDRDIFVKAVAAGRDPSSVRAAEIADQEEVVTIGADDSVEEAVRTMKSHKLRRLPVVDGQKLVGVLSQADIARALPKDKVGELVEAVSW
jgi:CBS domain-containing protein